MTYQADQFGLYLALAIHGGVHVDFVDEDALLNATVMSAYGILLATEPNIPKAAIKQLAAWVNAGGKLVLSGGAAVADEYNTTDGTLASLTGCELTPFPRRVLPEVRQSPGPSPLPFAANGTVASSSTRTQVPVTMFGDVSRFVHVGEGSEALGTFDATGAPSAVQSTVGSGSIVQMGWQPGLSYLINATQEFYVPNPRTQFPAAIRAFLQDLVSSAGAPAVTLTEPDGTKVVGVETVLLSSAAGAVVTVVNWGGVALSQALTLTLNLTAAGISASAKVGHVLDAATGKRIAPTGAISHSLITVPIAAVHANMK